MMTSRPAFAARVLAARGFWAEEPQAVKTCATDEIV
jgi:hypothetical protein